MSEGASRDREMDALCFGTRGLADVSRLVAVAALGMCSALRAGAVSPAYACRRLFGPALLTRLERVGASAELRDAIHTATELEDIADLFPERVGSVVADVEAQILLVLRSLPPPDDGEKWLLPPTA